MGKVPVGFSRSLRRRTRRLFQELLRGGAAGGDAFLGDVAGVFAETKFLQAKMGKLAKAGQFESVRGA